MCKSISMIVLALAVGWWSAVPALAQSMDRGGGLFLEPAITYEFGDNSVVYPGPFDKSTGKIQGFGVAARLGFHLNDMIFVAAEGRYSLPRFNSSFNNSSAEAKAWNVAPTVGVQMPDSGLRAWVSYVVAGDVDPDKLGGFDVRFRDAQGLRVGVGMYVSFVSLNLEYEDLSYDKTDVQAIGPFNVGDSFRNVHLNDKAWIASVSFPLAL